MTQATQSFTFKDLTARPAASVLRGFSAPVVLEHAADHAHLLAHDTDTFNRWEAGRTLARNALLGMITKGTRPDPAYLHGIRAVVTDDSLDPAYRALMLALPAQAELAAALHDAGHTPEPDIIHAALEMMREALARELRDVLPDLYAANQVTTPYAPDAVQAGQRALGNSVLSLLTRSDDGTLAQAQYDSADNMTQQLSALANLLRAGRGEAAVKTFETQWHGDRLVMDKWFGLQVIEADPEDAFEVAAGLTQHPDFNWKNPNRFRAVFGSLAMHHAGFHHASGAGYALLADWLIKLDPVNPQTTARMCSAFQTWKRYDTGRQALIRTQVHRILATPDLSRDTSEMLSRIMAA
jgi:aminopeptidase N